MKFNLASKPEDIKEIGYYPQATYHKNYGPNTKNSIWYIEHNSFPNFEPVLDISLHSKSKRTDFINLDVNTTGYVVSKKLKDALSKFNLPKHKFYKINVYHKKEILEYYWFYFVIDDFWEHLNTTKSFAEIVNADNLGIIEKTINIESKSQILKESQLYKFPYNCRTGKIVFKSNSPKYDFYKIQCLGYHKVFSDRLVNHLRQENITGLEFKRISFFEIEE